jgi:hypothetical protein
MKMTEMPRRKLSADALRVESFEPRARAAEIEFGPPTSPGASVPPCCSQQYVCI